MEPSRNTAWSATAALLAALLTPACTAPNPEYRGPDGGAPPDLLPAGLPFVPLHVGSEWLTLGANSLSLASTIDTSLLTIDGLPPPAGVVFAEQNGLAVLAVNSLDVPAQATVRVKGARPLVVVARTVITISGTLDGSGHFDDPGPGGSSTDQGSGAGRKGVSSPLDTGGGGGGYGGAGGAAGGVSGSCGPMPAPGVDGGPAWGDPMIAQLLGGSGGGSGSATGGCPVNSDCHGGAGGGALQLTAGDSIAITGAINAGGGGGKGGCKGTGVDVGGGGGGGGSGGSIVVEARIVTLTGTLSANGGGGGGGAFYSPGGNGGDGLPSTDSAAGGAGGRDNPNGGNEVVSQRGGLGGTLGQGGSSQSVTTCGNSGGGGGGTGRILVRSRTPVKPSPGSSPAPTVVTL